MVNHAKSLAVMSMVGSLMLERESGRIVHIDFGDLYETAAGMCRSG
jgi:phosphatidylinositol kinase/protein kinase (PI-3  family)